MNMGNIYEGFFFEVSEFEIYCANDTFLANLTRTNV